MGIKQVIYALTVLFCHYVLLAAGDYDYKYGRHNITMGRRQFHPPDVLLFHDSPKVKSQWVPYPKVQSHDVCYPGSGSHPARVTITAFNVTDLVPGGDGGYAFVTKGGVGYSQLCLHLKTQRGRGYQFNVDVWGYYSW